MKNKFFLFNILVVQTEVKNLYNKQLNYSCILNIENKSHLTVRTTKKLHSNTMHCLISHD